MNKSHHKLIWDEWNSNCKIHSFPETANLIYLMEKNLLRRRCINLGTNFPAENSKYRQFPCTSNFFRFWVWDFTIIIIELKFTISLLYFVFLKKLPKPSILSKFKLLFGNNIELSAAHKHTNILLWAHIFDSMYFLLFSQCLTSGYWFYGIFSYSYS